jgi:hypothetical protein
MPNDRERWRAFVQMLADFPTLRGATISVEANDNGGPPELVVEHPGRAVLGLDELSSGEQELAALTATILLSKAGIVAIEEPELGLDPGAQALVRSLCMKQRDAGFMSQVIFESHAPSVDGANVVRFRRDDAWTRVEATSTRDPVSEDAIADGARRAFVTRHGYTKLPEPMLKDLPVDQERGSSVWFLKHEGRWEAWLGEELAQGLTEKPR